MPFTFHRRQFFISGFLGLVIFTGGFTSQTSPHASFTELAPTPQESDAAMEVAHDLEHYHYLKPHLDTHFSEQVFTRYLQDLDPTHSYFLASDIHDFQAYRDSLAVNIKHGDLHQAFVIYNRFEQRMINRLNFELTLVQKKPLMDFTRKESLETNREHAPWSISQAAMDDLWRKRVKAAELSLTLAGKKPEDIKKLLAKRYDNQLSHIYQTRPDDAFQVFMDSLTESIDPHTEYFSPRVSENFNINMSLSLEGIGAVLQTEDEYTKVVRLVTGGPADKAHQLKPGDRIVAVAQANGDFVDVVGWRIDEVVDLIRGPKNSIVRLQILPAGAHDEHQTHVISITRNTVTLQDQAAKSHVIEIESGGIKHKIGIIELPTFYADFQAEQDGNPNYRSTTRDVRALIEALKKEQIEGLIMDLRNNGGGALQEANSLVGLFIDTGPTVQVRDSAGHVEVLGNSDSGMTYSGPLVVLVNRLSASASEIFTGAIQDYQRGLVVGATTYGKGSVQALRDVGYGQLKVTEAKFYRISGGSNQNKGIIPDIVFPSLIDDKDIGESAQPNAMPWDSIAPVQYQPYFDFKSQLPNLKLLDQQRIKTSPDFIYTDAELALLREQKNKTLISLQEATRRSEQDLWDKHQLDIENARRTAKGLPPLKALVNANDDSPADIPASATPSDEDIKNDGFLKESGYIILDWNRLSHSAPAPLPVNTALH
ncbi:MAG: carboxy terminal-processing peptidase [Pseudomonadales bacterium]|nr:carboxy terminal-processing peptidase [Pseudomonadales bacterium]